ncbi:hypothetical protein BJX61DRAFT_537965 [Aspergillus egyptiacus]|nr:hypothetical protein BJX61DRAFT_537965 [Aspergillus egyptiacus]
MAPMTDDAPPHRLLPGLQSISITSNMTEDRRLPPISLPLPRIEPHRDPFSPYSHRHFIPSPPSAHEPCLAKSPWPAMEHIVPPPSPAASADSWTDAVPPSRLHMRHQDISAFSMESIRELLSPNTSTRRKPLQQTHNRKRKERIISVDSSDQRIKHSNAEANRRKNLSNLIQQLDSRLHDWFLERAGWNRSKSLPQSKEHIVYGAILFIDFLLCIIFKHICPGYEPPQHLKDQMEPQLRCMRLEQQNKRAEQQIYSLNVENYSLRQELRALEKRNQALEDMIRSSQGDQLSQKVASSAGSEAKAMLPGLRVFCDEIASPDSSRLDALSTGTSRSFGHAFLSQTPPTTGPSSPVFNQAPYSVANS